MHHRPALWFHLAAAILLAAAGPAVRSQSSSAQALVVTEPQAVQAAEMLFQEVQKVAKRVTPCVESRQGTPADCACRFPAELGQLQSAARRIQALYPAWEGKVVNWTDPVSKLSRAISLEAVLRQSSLKCTTR